jgi:hypothetical protein
MFDIAEKLTGELNQYSKVIYVDDAFPWKELVYGKYGNQERFLLSSDAKEAELYRMYEFSDRFVVLSESEQYGSIWNYVRSGIMTPEEALELLIGA